jgi:hypothetical protein
LRARFFTKVHPEALFMSARVVAVLSLLGVGWVAIHAIQLLREAHRIESLPTWPSHTGPVFEMEVGQQGRWDVHWDDVEGAVGNGVLWLDMDASKRIEPKTTEVFARVNPSGSARPGWKGSERDDDWLLLGSTWDFGPAPIVDLRAVRSIEYRVARVGPDLRGTRAWLEVCGSCDAEPEVAERLKWSALIQIVAFGGPSLLIFAGAVVVLIRKSRAPVSATPR